jgi:DNA-3-methyladenine glycosylase
MKSTSLPESYYLNQDVLFVAKDLLGKVLVTNFNGNTTSGVITETEAYFGVNDRASHAFGGKVTARNSVMYRAGGIAYIYLCYGIHSLFNVVTNISGVPHAVLIRGIYPLHGLKVMMKRRKAVNFRSADFSGPGKVSQALGIHHSMSGMSLIDTNLRIEDMNIHFTKNQISETPRIGVDYAGEDALLPFRYLVKNVSDVEKALTYLPSAFDRMYLTLPHGDL